jgi:hypothetical protein
MGWLDKLKTALAVAKVLPLPKKGAAIVGGVERVTTDVESVIREVKETPKP